MNRNERIAMDFGAAVVACLLAAAAVAQEPAGIAVPLQLDSKAMEWEASSAPGFPEGASRKLLHRHPESGAAAVLRRHPKGYVEPRHWHSSASHSVYILSGSVRYGDSVAGPGHFFYAPAGHRHGPIEALEDVEFLLWSDGPLDLHIVEGDGPDPD